MEVTIKWTPHCTASVVIKGPKGVRRIEEEETKGLSVKAIYDMVAELQREVDGLTLSRVCEECGRALKIVDIHDVDGDPVSGTSITYTQFGCFNRDCSEFEGYDAEEIM